MEKTSKQMEFEKFPERTPLGKAAIEYLNLRDQQENIENKVSLAKREVIAEFRKSGINKVRIEKVTLSYAHTESDKIVVKGRGEEV